MVGSCANNANIDPVPLIPSGETVDDIDTIPCVQVVDSAFPVDFPDLSEGFTIHVSVVLDGGVATARDKPKADKR